MKFVVLALCVCAASAASLVRPGVWPGTTKVQVSASIPAQITQSVVPKNVNVQGTSDAESPILRSEADVTAEGFNYVYETGNGISHQASGNLKKVDNLDVINVQGSYRYTAPDGTPVVFNYVADENGYQPQSDLIPVAPPVPVAIARALEYIAAHPAPPESVVGVRVGAKRV